MSEAPAEEYPPPTVDHLPNKPDFGSDIILWRRKVVNIVILAVATATWIAIEMYQYNLITLISWAAIALVVSCFLWGNMHRFFKREAPDLSELEIKEETAIENARLLKQRAEEVIRLMLQVSGEREWFVFAGVVTCLYLVSVVAAHLDFLTICYIGIVGGLTIPVIYVKKEEKIREIGEKLRMKTQRLQAIMEGELRKIKSRMAGKRGQEIKDKKEE
ncbi:hypothetical protein ACS0TY_030446 [Phlomoides rotata]